MDALTRLITTSECERLIKEYCRTVDLGDAAHLADLFVAEGRFEVTSARGNRVSEGRDEIRRDWAFVAEFDGIYRHFCSNILVDVLSGDFATATSYVLVYAADQIGNEPGSASNIGDYYDELVRIDGTWRFKSRRLDVRLHPAAWVPGGKAKR